MAEVTLFAGPSARRGSIDGWLREGIVVRPPVRRGDVDAVISAADRPGVIVVCDGMFEVRPAVSHAELCRALDAKWQVWGVSSIGAIRAHEMRHQGMQGFGYVHSLFQHHDDLADDEMCHLHYPEEPYFAVSEPLVNLRYALDRCGKRLGISDEASSQTVESLRSCWFGERTRERIEAVLVVEGGICRRRARTLMRWLDRYPVKSLDLLRLMRSRPWQPSGGAATPAPGC